MVVIENVMSCLQGVWQIYNLCKTVCKKGKVVRNNRPVSILFSERGFEAKNAIGLRRSI